MLPECLVPFKHYDTQLIEDVVDGDITPEDNEEIEDYPCDNTQNNWKAWIGLNETNINGMLRSIGYNLLGLGIKFLRIVDSLLKKIQERKSPGWLIEIIRVIYNAGKRITPLSMIKAP